MHRTHAPQAASLLRKLLQLLLCASVLLNGVTAATASVRVAAMALEVPAAIASNAAAAADPGCHDAAATGGHQAGMGMAHAAMAASDLPAADAHSGHDEQECLQFCMDICMQHCHALFGGHALPPSLLAEAAPLVSLDTGLQSLPRLPPIRPPIA